MRQVGLAGDKIMSVHAYQSGVSAGVEYAQV
jgi:hypothetical protein